MTKWTLELEYIGTTTLTVEADDYNAALAAARLVAADLFCQELDSNNEFITVSYDL